MGACCSKNSDFRGIIVEDDIDDKEYGHEEDGVRHADGGAIARLRGSSKYVSMAIRQGKKGINQDAMTVWENFTGEKDVIFCGVFDGHGPMGHKIARHVREHLPSRIHSVISSSQSDGNISGESNISQNHEDLFRGFEAVLAKSFKQVDDELGLESAYDSFCSGTTAVTVIKQGDCLVIANLGDSRSVLCTLGNKNQLLPVQLTVDMKPNVPSEAERIKSCKGRVFAMDEEPDVYRVWMPDDNCPGLAMSRAFGDFCLKDYGLLSVPEVSCRKITSRDEFVVLATDGIWDVLSNEEVIKTVASSKDRSKAAETLIHRAAWAWRTKYPVSKADDCAVVILFLNNEQPLSDKSVADVKDGNISQAEFRTSRRSRSTRSTGRADDESVGVDMVSRVNSTLKLPRFGCVSSHRGSEKANATVVVRCK